MADFKIAQEYVIQVAEGGYRLINIKDDKGGMTYAGISRRSNPKWAGWRYIDKGIIEGNDLINLADKLYFDNYWQPILGSEIESQVVATAVYSSAVLSGVSRATRLIQSSLEYLEPAPKIDGVMGPNTIQGINIMRDKVLLELFALRRVKRYWEICEKNKSQRKFEHGWIARALRELP